ncbi:50S ribosomal protein L13 [Phycisphaera mikurensis]|uniref:Large ribosomal subunit protein uL13 n=1 Tax=Phycisphaera mikurensis (strain NBRC 102666 / KCTC 22515 / FYK2301M01) TaxID=1142394 RepID=I0IE81_PHYMF|nr:50S ribosomal protein L13 [Phycisphaera mikurensis]MBB6441372.1 large subunit ribosomal protein L13 [Phycisphaera mikurensis]BAM03569.1 50S ribosomal protein L13 [Phycisphaera mikurensis NBRC 102666]
MNRQTTLARRNGQEETFPRGWAIVDAEGAVLGRLAAKVAFILQGKDKPHYTNHVDVGDFVVVVNADKVRVTGTKLDDKFHERFSGHPSGRHITTWREVLDGKHPERLVETAVRRMLPKSKLGVAQYGKLKVYAGAEHPHAAQNPRTVSLASLALQTS